MAIVVGIDLGTQSLKAVVCDERLAVLGARSVSYATALPRARPAPSRIRADVGARARARDRRRARRRRARAARRRRARDRRPARWLRRGRRARRAPLHPALIWQDRRATATPRAPTPARVFELTGQVADPSHLAPKLAWLRAHGVRGGALSPAGQLPRRAADRRSGARSCARLDDDAVRPRARGAWSPELLAAFAIDRADAARRCARRARSPARSTRAGAALTGLRAGTPVAVGTGDDFATPLGAGVVAPGPISARSAPPRSSGRSPRAGVRRRAARAAIDPWRALAEPMVETHAYPTGAYFVENPGLALGRRRALGARACSAVASDAELDALAATRTARRRRRDVHPRARRRDDAGVAPARARRRCTASPRRTIARTSRARCSRASRSRAATSSSGSPRSGLPARRRARARRRREQRGVAPDPRRRARARRTMSAARTDTCAIGAAMIAAVAAGVAPDLAAAARARAAAGSDDRSCPPASLDEAYAPLPRARRRARPAVATTRSSRARARCRRVAAITCARVNRPLRPTAETG